LLERVLSRFGPRLPQMAEAALIHASSPPLLPPHPALSAWARGIGGAVLVAPLVALGALL
jgi:hypothetical protein